MKRNDLIAFGIRLFVLGVSLISITLAIERYRKPPETAEYVIQGGYRVVEYNGSKFIRDIDLNDYLAAPDDDTDYNCTEIGDEEERILEENGIFYNQDLGCWCRKISSYNK